MTEVSCSETGCQPLLDEHLEMHGLLDEIRAMLAAKESDFGEVASRLARARDLLTQHFEHEEAEGYFFHVIRVAPQYKLLVDSLCQEHPKLSEQITALVEEAEQLPGSDACWGYVERQFKAFSFQLSRHESKENRMVQQAYNRDIGTSD